MRAAGGTCAGNVYAPNPKPLIFDCRLWKAAQLHSQDMADKGYFSHTSLDGRRFWDRAGEQGIGASAENIARGSSDPDSVLRLWAGSSGHCSNMMNPAYTMMGVGYAFPGHFWTQMFKSTQVPVDASCYPPADAALLTQATREDANAEGEDSVMLKEKTLAAGPEVVELREVRGW